MNTAITMFVAASLILVVGAVAVATPHTLEAAPSKVWCFKSGLNLICSATAGGAFFEKKADCKTYAENSGLAISEGCKRINPFVPT